MNIILVPYPGPWLYKVGTLKLSMFVCLFEVFHQGQGGHSPLVIFTGVARNVMRYSVGGAFEDGCKI